MPQTWDKSEIPHCDNCKSLLTRVCCDVWHCHLCGTLVHGSEEDRQTTVPTLVSLMHDFDGECLRDDRSRCCVFDMARQAAGMVEPKGG